ncbi:hypothetical protein [Winogradskyella immobilis]|uniref:ParB/Sulfiredoxin domain-containing protein n=1 Tax=Winogradskyella immobilis TaxID=2816852 RepID=A0ABS8ERA5_9FLAO|nr:hypothetical protein [Winogradskyella immobilis]MCC1485640.1 hypothetical protein [Winogradskyella immobilis]MCG0017732.1 hypothetical protein [Winogradskyella immobilis]
MADKIPGAGRKRPQLNIPLNQLLVDNENPRLAEQYMGKEEEEILSVLYEQFDLEEIAFSMVSNGYFDEEPIVVVPINLPAEFDETQYQDVNDLQNYLEQLTQESNLQFRVLEGNRRTATAKLLTDAKLRAKIGVTEDFPAIDNPIVTEDLKQIPAIVYLNEEDVSPYLGIRHISGNLRWEAFAKAVYLAKLIEKESSSKNISLNESIQSVRKIIPDRTDSIKKQYTAYKILKELRSNYNFNVKQIRNRFSLVTEITNKPDLRQYLNIENYNKIDLSNDVINDDNSDKFVQVFTWVFGNGNDIEPLFKDSRLIGKRLGPILADETATEHLIKHGNIEEAYERSGGEEKFFNKQLYEAQRKIENSLTIAYKFKGKQDSIKQANDLLEAVNALNENLK